MTTYINLKLAGSKEVETVDEAETWAEAGFLLKEYRMSDPQNTYYASQRPDRTYHLSPREDLGREMTNGH